MIKQVISIITTTVKPEKGRSDTSARNWIILKPELAPLEEPLDDTEQLDKASNWIIIKPELTPLKSSDDTDFESVDWAILKPELTPLEPNSTSSNSTSSTTNEVEKDLDVPLSNRRGPYRHYSESQKQGFWRMVLHEGSSAYRAAICNDINLQTAYTWKKNWIRRTVDEQNGVVVTPKKRGRKPKHVEVS
ncbi:hypothetical protein Cantr_03507 [Candida viswanathii]|uniref:Uncharacterized protein n=1 Tax=Candida viswanathii TaxID=5486 RepID=A0A367YP30_9ASCO|nr:hypothetical protein Cantr_03507 [Candida viswanathii]